MTDPANQNKHELNLQNKINDLYKEQLKLEEKLIQANADQIKQLENKEKLAANAVQQAHVALSRARDAIANGKISAISEQQALDLLDEKIKKHDELLATHKLIKQELHEIDSFAKSFANSLSGALGMSTKVESVLGNMLK